MVDQTFGFSPVGNGDLAVAGGEFKPVHRDLACLDGFVDLGARNSEREIDELKGLGDGPVFLTDFDRGLLRDVVAAEYTKGSVHVQVARDHHNGLRVGILGRRGKPLDEVLASDGVLNVNVDTERSYKFQCMLIPHMYTNPSALRVNSVLRTRRNSTCSLPVRKTLNTNIALTT